MPTVNPYLAFSNTCEVAFDFYRSVFGGEFTMIVRFKEMPGPHIGADEAEKIMHVSLPLGKEQ